MTECGHTLHELTPQGLNAIFERMRGILHEGAIDKRVQYMIEALYSKRKSGFADAPGVVAELDLVEAEDQITHEVSLDDELTLCETLDYFNFDPEYEANEQRFREIKREILGDSESDDDDDDDDDDEDDDEEEEEEEKDCSIQ